MPDGAAAHGQLPQRFHLLDALRGVAALAVVCFHWQNLLVKGDVELAGYAGRDLPFQDTLQMFYQHGFLAVDLFFSLSGFIFFCFYADKVTRGRVSSVQFFVLRFSRLYPLYLVTLLVAAGAQALYLRAHGHHMAYWHNDIYHLALHLPLLSSVGLEKGLGFNGPAWSISVEAVLYLAFFLVCRAGRTRPWVLLLISAFGFFLLSRLYLPLGRGIGSFFMGGLVFVIYRRLLMSPHHATVGGVVLGIVTVMWVVIWLAHLNAWSFQGIPIVGRGVHRFPTLVLFPLTVLALALAESWCTTGAARALSWLGDVSYSSYLWHFPLQLIFALVVTGFGVSTEVFKSGAALLLFMAVLLLLSWASHRLLEMPAQDALRRRWLRRPAAA